MPQSLFGPPDSVQRYVIFGAVAGAVAAVLATAFGVPLFVFGAPAALITGWVAGGIDTPKYPTPTPG